MRSTYCIILTICLTLCFLAVVPKDASADRVEAILSDHTCTDISGIPVQAIEEAKDLLRISYGHTSHGSQPIFGMRVLMEDPSHAGLYDFTDDGTVMAGALSIHDWTPAGDLGNVDWPERTRAYLAGEGSDRNVVIWSWCGQVSGASEQYINDYLADMSALEIEYPNKTFVYMTGHLDGTGEQGNLHQRNNQIRDYCIANNKVLFDFADIESYNPDGDYFRDLFATDSCNYDGGNWADEWCAENAEGPLCFDCNCAHSQPLNCNIKGRAFWWLLATIAGWNPEGAATTACDLVCQPASGTLPFQVRFTTTLTNIYTGFTRKLAGRIDVELAGGNRISRWRSGSTNIPAGESKIFNWSNTLPATSSMVGQSTFTLVCIDLTPPPYNQPPYPPAGHSDSSSCSVTGVAP